MSQSYDELNKHKCHEFKPDEPLPRTDPSLFSLAYFKSLFVSEN